ncbi:hypothetical protein DERP_011757 [Dermatophagoides pteronyssinus]|uniref:Uncharacterized protein n=1 Tax=Dermatophagoides pteronyssinus TaxID=6956 RepID=A0ABQ8J373_DERPT|nr:hypothetical protein DERP_011757 [Dermatophagoides pteronyssinus]
MAIVKGQQDVHQVGAIPIQPFNNSSAIKILTNAYSINDANTNTVHDDINISIAFIYDTGGNDFCDCACCVDNVNNDVTHNVTRAGTASGFIQNDIHDIITIKHVGIYV